MAVDQEKIREHREKQRQKLEQQLKEKGVNTEVLFEGKKGVLGNQRTPLKILEGLIYNADGNVNPELIDVFKHSLGEQTGQMVYNKVKGIVDSMKKLSL